MKRKLLAMVFSCFIAMSLVGCGGEPGHVLVNVSNSENISSNQLGEFVKIGDRLCYDSATRIVYVKYYTYSGHNVYVPYYAPNGLPYRYNPETNTFEEISN